MVHVDLTFFVHHEDFTSNDKINYSLLANIFNFDV